MGHTIWVDVQGRSEDPMDSSIMLQLQKQLERVSKKLKVPKLSDFYDYSELEAEYGGLEDDDNGEGDDAASSDGDPKGSWFDPAPALSAVRAIHGHLSQHPEDLGLKPDPSRAHWPTDLMEELKQCQATLQDAVSRGVKFRFLIVP